MGTFGRLRNGLRSVPACRRNCSFATVLSRRFRLADEDAVRVEMHGHGAAGGLRVAVTHGVQYLLVRVDGHGEQLLARDVGDRDHGRVDDRHQRLDDHVVRAFRASFKPIKSCSTPIFSN